MSYYEDEQLPWPDDRYSFDLWELEEIAELRTLDAQERAWESENA